MPQKLRPAQRMRGQRLFQLLFKKGKFAKGIFLHLWAYALPPEEKSRGAKIGIIVSRKVALRATRRNLIKRRIKEAFRLNQQRIKVNRAILVQARQSTVIPTYEVIEKELLMLLARTESLV